MYSYQLLCMKLKYSEYSFYYTILQHGLYWDPSKGNVITDSVITASPIAFIFTRYCLLSIFYRFMSNDRNFVWKMYMQSTLIYKQHILYLIYTTFKLCPVVRKSKLCPVVRKSNSSVENCLPCNPWIEGSNPGGNHTSFSESHRMNPFLIKLLILYP